MTYGFDNALWLNEQCANNVIFQYINTLDTTLRKYDAEVAEIMKD